jgi:hypothetical protein
MFDLIRKQENVLTTTNLSLLDTFAIIDGGIVFWVDEEVVLTPPVEIKSAGERRIEVEHS